MNDAAVIDVDPAPYTGPIDPNLGLKLIRGPIRYVFMVPRSETQTPYPLPVLVLLGDEHDVEFCEKTCADPGCVAAQNHTHNTFLTHLDTVYGDFAPDVFLEAWVDKEDRVVGVGDGDGADPPPRHFSLYKEGPMNNYIWNALPCAYPHKKVHKHTGSLVTCPYKNLRVHVGDTRTKIGEIEDLYESLFAHLSGPFELLAEQWAAAFPEVAPEAIVESLLDVTPLKYLHDPFFQTHSRVAHELRQLPPAILDLVAAALVAQPKPPVLDSTTVRLIRRWARADGLLALPQSKVNHVVRKMAEPLEYLGAVTVDLYCIARALKLRRDGTKSLLAVNRRQRLQRVAPVHGRRCARVRTRPQVHCHGNAD
jgi:hypothetical protein